MGSSPGMVPLNCVFLERTTGFEPATPTLARWCSTTEPRPRNPSSLGAVRGAFNRFSERRMPTDVAGER